jgi:hypothetical protein
MAKNILDQINVQDLEYRRGIEQRIPSCRDEEKAAANGTNLQAKKGNATAAMRAHTRRGTDT